MREYVEPLITLSGPQSFIFSFSFSDTFQLWGNHRNALSLNYS